MNLARTDSVALKMFGELKMLPPSQSWNKAPRMRLGSGSHNIHKMGRETSPTTMVNALMARMKGGAECPPEAFMKGTVM